MLVVAAVVSGCASGGGSRASVSEDSLSYAIRQMHADTSDQARLAEFLTLYGERSTQMRRPWDYLQELHTLTELREGFRASAAVLDFSAQQMGTYASFLGEYAEALRWFDGPEAARRPAESELALAGLEPADAVSVIVARANEERAVFVNEAHHVPQHRALTLALLEPLYALGFRYLALETLGVVSPDTLLNDRGYPLQGSGFYSKEPLFGEVIRQALELGYTVVPYEASGERTQDGRETGQARNLKEWIFDRDPGGRVLLHAGYAHIDESGLIAGAVPMAARFRELTGIDPLTVGQTTMTEHSDTVFEPPEYRRALERYPRRAPFVLREPGGSLWSARPTARDITVFSPRTVLREGRPEWLWAAGERVAYHVPPLFCGDVDECVVAAWLAAESEDAVPVDIVVQRRGATPTLLLRPGEYRIVGGRAGGGLLNQIATTIPRR